MNTSLVTTRTTRRTLLIDTCLYLCTDSCAPRGDLRELLYACYEGDTGIIQLHGKKVDTRDEIVTVKTPAGVVAKHGRLFAVNDRADTTALAGADILHVGQESLTTEQARQIVGPGVPTGRSSRNLDTFAASLIDDGIDYVVVSLVYTIPAESDR